MGSGQPTKPSKANRRLANDLKQVDKILAHGQTDPGVQRRFCTRLVELCAKIEGFEDVRAVRNRLDISPVFVQDSALRLDYARGLATAAGKCDVTEDGMAVAAEIETIPGYAASRELQELGARAWFRATAREASVRHQRLAASKIAASPGFSDVVDIQRAYAKTVCNTTANLIPPAEAGELIAGLERLSHHQDDEIQEALRRSRYNLEQLEKRQSERRASLFRFLRRISLVLLVLGLVAGAFLYVPSALASLYETEAREANTENRIYKVQLEAAEKAIKSGKAEEAIAHLKVIYRAARSADDEAEARRVAQRITQLYHELGDVPMTASYSLKLGTESRKEWCRTFAAELKAETEAEQYAQALSRAEQLIRMEAETGIDALPTKLSRAQLLEHCGRSQEALGYYQQLLKEHPDSEKAQEGLSTLKKRMVEERLRQARAALQQGESSVAYQRFAEIKELAGSDYDAQIRTEKQNAAVSLLQEAERALKEGRDATQAAKAASSLFGTDQERARATTVMAKQAYLGKRFDEAHRLARKALEGDPQNQDYQQRLKAYEQKDLAVLERHEIRPNLFRFPPIGELPGKKRHTQIYLLSSSEKERVVEGRQLIWTPLKVKMRPQVSRYDSRRRIRFEVQTSKRDHYSLEFRAPDGQNLRVRSYDFSSRDYRGAHFKFSGSGRYPRSPHGDFVIRELRYTSKGDLVAFAADFVQYERNKNEGVYGRVRYKSRFE